MGSRFLMILALIVLAGAVFSGAEEKPQCDGDGRGLVIQCGMYVQFLSPTMEPSERCCRVIKAADVACFCKNISKPTESFIDMKKVVYVAKFCGKPLPNGLKCGSYTVPEVKFGGLY